MTLKVVAVLLAKAKLEMVTSESVHNNIRIINMCTDKCEHCKIVHLRVDFTFNHWNIVVAVENASHYNNGTLIPLPQVGVVVHHYLLIGGGAREGSVSRDG